MSYDLRTITHGTQQVTYSDLADETKVEYATGVKSFATKVDQDSASFYADAQVHMTLSNPAKLTITQTNYQISDVEHNQSGESGNSKSGFTDNGISAPFNVQRIMIKQGTDGSKVKVLTAYYNVTAGAWTESDDEDEDSIKPKTFERTLTINGSDMTMNGTSSLVKKFEIEETAENAAVFDTYATKVLKPSDFANQTNSGTNTGSDGK